MSEPVTDFGENLADPARRAASGRRSQTPAYLGVILIAIGLAAWAFYAVASGSERHSYTSGVAPTRVELTAGNTYRIAIPGGVRAEQVLGVEPGDLTCRARPPSGRATTLRLTTEDTNSKATDQIASFVAAESGSVHLDCVGLPAVFVDNADDADGDISGLWLVLASAALALGLPLTLSVLRRPAEYQDL